MASESGSFSICQFVYMHDDSEGDWKTIVWGYDTFDEAVSDLENVSTANNIPTTELGVIQIWSLDSFID